MQTARDLSGKLDRIVFMGFMGAGKSTVGRLLAQRLGWPFVDADLRLEERAGRTIAELFAAFGESEFRRMEAGVVEEALREKKSVLALGGGAVESDSTRAALLESGSGTCAVFLDAPLATLIERCEQQPGAAVRPVLNDRDQLHARWQRRLPFYRQAHLTVDTTGLTPEMVVEQVMETLCDRLEAPSVQAKHLAQNEFPR